MSQIRIREATKIVREAVMFNTKQQIEKETFDYEKTTSLCSRFPA